MLAWWTVTYVCLEFGRTYLQVVELTRDQLLWHFTRGYSPKRAHQFLHTEL
jgi:hypothetical protein